MNTNLLSALSLTIAASTAHAQSLTPTNGMREAVPTTTAIVGATIRVSQAKTIEHGTVIFTDGLITAVGEVNAITIPNGATIIIAEGLTLAPAFVEPQLEVDIVRSDAGDGRHPVARVHPEIDVATLPLPEDRMKILRGAGFATARLIPKTGAVAGTTALIALDESSNFRGAYASEQPMLLRFEYGGTYRSAVYPGSLTGSVALIRQTLYDAKWHAQNSNVASKGSAVPPLPSDSLTSLYSIVDGKQEVIFDMQHEFDAALAKSVAEEFNLSYSLLGNGTEYRRLDEVASLNKPIVVPVNFPKRPDLSSPDQIEAVNLRTLMDWEQAPTNPRRLLRAGVPISITMNGIDDSKTFLRNIQKAIKQGLSEEEAFAALTDSVVLTAGGYANLQLFDGELLDPDRTLRDVWINGRRHQIERDNLPAGSSDYALHVAGGVVTATIDRDDNRLSLRNEDDKKISLRKTTMTRDGITAVIDTQPLGGTGWGQLVLVAVGETLSGSITMSDGSRFVIHGKPIEAANITADGESYTGWMKIGSYKMEITLSIPSAGGTPLLRSDNFEMTLQDFSKTKSGELSAWFERSDGSRRDFLATIEGNEIRGELTGGKRETTLHLVLGTSPPPEVGEDNLAPQDLPIPFGAYGRFAPPSKQDIRFEHATLWTASEAGIIEDGCLIIQDGKIAYVGTMEHAPVTTMEIIDSSGVHITPGLIDAHSHTGLRGGVNEWTQANTAEVRMSDVINPDDINFYRQLAGGLTTANQLHGSANPIGGQSSVVQLRWGEPSSYMPFRGAMPAIKFALGENVKRSPDRYPNTRMGVESFDRDEFLAARDYKANWEEWNALPSYKRSQSLQPRKDLELDTLVEILDGERLVHCHSYRQDEILMLLRLAEELGFRIGTFQHVLEGYKVAELLADGGVHASCFSDWWAYKEEVMDAIPYNGAIMHDVGAVVSFNSDSSNLARRMNTEATKAIRWGELTPEEAIKFVTINPAIQLGIEDMVGSLEKNKQADIAIWNGDPLATNTKCLQTWIEGAPYFDIEEDAQLQQWAASERTRILDAALAAEYGSLEKPEEPKEETQEYTCTSH